MRQTATPVAIAPRLILDLPFACAPSQEPGQHFVCGFIALFSQISILPGTALLWIIAFWTLHCLWTSEFDSNWWGFQTVIYNRAYTPSCRVGSYYLLPGPECEAPDYLPFRLVDNFLQSSTFSQHNNFCLPDFTDTGLHLQADIHPLALPPFCRVGSYFSLTGLEGRHWRGTIVFWLPSAADTSFNHNTLPYRTAWVDHGVPPESYLSLLLCGRLRTSGTGTFSLWIANTGGFR